jgi:hypothetical protein
MLLANDDADDANDVDDANDIDDNANNADNTKANDDRSRKKKDHISTLVSIESSDS